MEQTDVLPVIVESIDIAAPIGAVFAALTEPEELVRWWGREGRYQTTHVVSDLRVGGAWEMRGVSADGDAQTLGGVYRIVEAPRRLEFTWGFVWTGGDRSANETVVRYDLEGRGSLTRVTVTHTGFTDRIEHAEHEQGWKTVLAWLAESF